MRAVISGIGFTRFSSNSGMSTAALATDAARAAMVDAGLTARDVDGLVSYHQNDSALTRDVSPGLGLTELNWWSDIVAGGTFNCAVVGLARAVVESGMATHVVCYRALNGRSGTRIGRYRAAQTEGAAQFLTPYGFVSAAQMFGMTARRHMSLYGTTREQMGLVAITMRDNATRNERAMRREPLTMEKYLSGRIIADPYTLYDCCQESDGACAVVVSRADAVPNPARAVEILSVVHGSGENPRIPFDNWPDLTVSAFRRLGADLFRRAGLQPKDVDVALLYDAFTYEVIQQLEELGFCELGEGGPFVQSGAIARDGALPVNPHGGLLSEAYVHGLNHVVEAVIQMRGEAGPRQIPGARTALVTGFGFTAGSALILGGNR